MTELLEEAPLTEHESTNGKALQIICALMAGMLSTILFMWMTFPRNLATTENVDNVVAVFQKEVDQLQAAQAVDREERANMNVKIGRIEERDKIDDR